MFEFILCLMTVSLFFFLLFFFLFFLHIQEPVYKQKLLYVTILSIKLDVILPEGYKSP